MGACGTPAQPPVEPAPVVVVVEARHEAPAASSAPIATDPPRAPPPSFGKLSVVPDVHAIAAGGALAWDASFGVKGRAVLGPGAGETQMSHAVALADGSIFVVGHAPLGNLVPCVVKLDPRGKPDRSFGEQGYVRFADEGAFGSQIALDSKGRIVVTAYVYQGAQGANLVVARLLSNGQLDASFGTNGIVTRDFGNSDDRPSGLFALTTGELLVVGIHGARGKDESYVAAFDESGNKSARFSDGVVFTDPLPGKEFTTRALIDDAGNIVLGGYMVGTKGSFVARLRGDGSPDEKFGDGGVTALRGAPFGTSWALARQSDGKILIGGQASDDTAFVARLGTDGKLDPTWGKNGVAQGPSRAGDQFYALFARRDRTVVGVGFRGLANDAHALAIAFDANGKRDASFAPDGVLLGATRGDFAEAATTDANGAILTTGMTIGKGSDIGGLVLRLAPKTP